MLHNYVLNPNFKIKKKDKVRYILWRGDEMIKLEML